MFIRVETCETSRDKDPSTQEWKRRERADHVCFDTNLNFILKEMENGSDCLTYPMGIQLGLI